MGRPMEMKCRIFGQSTCKGCIVSNIEIRGIVCLTLTSISAVFRSTQLGQIGNCSRIHSLPVRVVECFVLSSLSCTKSLTTFHYYSDGHVAGLQRTAKSSHRHSHMSSPSRTRTGNPWKAGPILPTKLHLAVTHPITNAAIWLNLSDLRGSHSSTFPLVTMGGLGSPL